MMMKDIFLLTFVKCPIPLRPSLTRNYLNYYELELWRNCAKACEKQIGLSTLDYIYSPNAPHVRNCSQPTKPNQQDEINKRYQIRTQNTALHPRLYLEETSIQSYDSDSP